MLGRFANLCSPPIAKGGGHLVAVTRSIDQLKPTDLGVNVGHRCVRTLRVDVDFVSATNEPDNLIENEGLRHAGEGIGDDRDLHDVWSVIWIQR